MGTILLITAAILGTGASLIFVEYLAEASLITAFFPAIAIWLPTNTVFVKGLTVVKNVGVALVIFTISSTISDTLGGLFLQGAIQNVKNPYFIIMGLTAGIAVIVLQSKENTEEKKADPHREKLLYIAGILSLGLAIIFREVWWILIIIYGLVNLWTASWADKMSENHSLYITAIATSAPLIFVVMILLQEVGNVAIVGPSATIMSCGMAIVGDKWRTKTPQNLRGAFLVALSALCIGLIYFSF